MKLDSTHAAKCSLAQQRGSDGFSVVELLITLTVAALAVILIGTMYASAGRLSDRSTDLLAANSVAYAKLEKYENFQFNSIPFTTDGTPVEDFSNELPSSLPGPRLGRVFISLYPPSSTTLKYIFVRVQYGNGADQHTIEYGDFVQAGGLGR